MCAEKNSLLQLFVSFDFDKISKLFIILLILSLLYLASWL